MQNVILIILLTRGLATTNRKNKLLVFQVLSNKRLPRDKSPTSPYPEGGGGGGGGDSHIKSTRVLARRFENHT